MVTSKILCYGIAKRIKIQDGLPLVGSAQPSCLLCLLSLFWPGMVLTQTPPCALEKFIFPFSVHFLFVFPQKGNWTRPFTTCLPVTSSLLFDRMLLKAQPKGDSGRISGTFETESSLFFPLIWSQEDTVGTLFQREEFIIHFLREGRHSEEH